MAEASVQSCFNSRPTGSRYTEQVSIQSRSYRSVRSEDSESFTTLLKVEQVEKEEMT